MCDVSEPLSTLRYLLMELRRTTLLIKACSFLTGRCGAAGRGRITSGRSGGHWRLGSCWQARRAPSDDVRPVYLSLRGMWIHVNKSFLFLSSITFGVLKYGHFKFLLFFYFISLKLNGNMAFICRITYVALQLVLFCIFKASEIKALYDRLSDFDKRPLQYEARVSGRTTARFAKSKRSGHAGVDAVRR